MRLAGARLSFKYANSPLGPRYIGWLQGRGDGGWDGAMVTRGWDQSAISALGGWGGVRE